MSILLQRAFHTASAQWMPAALVITTPRRCSEALSPLFSFPSCPSSCPPAPLSQDPPPQQQRQPSSRSLVPAETQLCAPAGPGAGRGLRAGGWWLVAGTSGRPHGTRSPRPWLPERPLPHRPCGRCPPCPPCPPQTGRRLGRADLFTLRQCWVFCP